MSIQRYDENRDSDIYLKFWFSIGHVGIPAALSHEFNYLTTSLTHSCIPLISLHVVSFYFLSFISMYSFPSVCSTHLFPFFHSIIHSFNSIPIHVMSSLVISIHVIPYPASEGWTTSMIEVSAPKTCKQKKQRNGLDFDAPNKLVSV